MEKEIEKIKLFFLVAKIQIIPLKLMFARDALRTLVPCSTDARQADTKA